MSALPPKADIRTIFHESADIGGRTTRLPEPFGNMRVVRNVGTYQSQCGAVVSFLGGDRRRAVIHSLYDLIG